MLPKAGRFLPQQASISYVKLHFSLSLYFSCLILDFKYLMFDWQRTAQHLSQWAVGPLTPIIMPKAGHTYYYCVGCLLFSRHEFWHATSPAPLV